MGLLIRAGSLKKLSAGRGGDFLLCFSLSVTLLVLFMLLSFSCLFFANVNTTLFGCFRDVASGWFDLTLANEGAGPGPSLRKSGIFFSLIGFGREEQSKLG